MRFCKCFLIITFILLVQNAFADETRMYRLVQSSLLQKLEEGGVWEVEVLTSKVNYHCLKCEGAVDAAVEVLTSYTSENHASFEQRYLSERKSFCANLVTVDLGRCVQTYATGMRGGALKGFQSEHEFEGERVIEIVFFYNELQYGPELIKSTISIEDGVELPEDMIEILRWHMARLTLWW